MKHVFKNLIIGSLLFLAACGGDKPAKEETKDTTAKQEQKEQADEKAKPEKEEASLKGEYCFVLTEKNKNKTTVNLNIVSNDEITGEMIWEPYNQDGAAGSLTGKMRENKELELIYSFEIEGSKQSERMVMKIENDKLHIKRGAMEPDKDGVLTIKDESKAKYDRMLDKVDCQKK